MVSGPVRNMLGTPQKFPLIGCIFKYKIQHLLILRAIRILSFPSHCFSLKGFPLPGCNIPIKFRLETFIFLPLPFKATEMGRGIFWTEFYQYPGFPCFCKDRRFCQPRLCGPRPIPSPASPSCLIQFLLFDCIFFDCFSKNTIRYWPGE